MLIAFETVIHFVQINPFIKRKAKKEGFFLFGKVRLEDLKF